MENTVDFRECNGLFFNDTLWYRIVMILKWTRYDIRQIYLGGTVMLRIFCLLFKIVEMKSLMVNLNHKISGTKINNSLRWLYGNLASYKPTDWPSSTAHGGAWDTCQPYVKCQREVDNQ